jgi:hypothetical protein
VRLPSNNLQYQHLSTVLGIEQIKCWQVQDSPISTQATKIVADVNEMAGDEDAYDLNEATFTMRNPWGMHHFPSMTY